MRWLDDVADPIAEVSGMPDALAVRDEAGELVGWDESPCCAWLAARGRPCSAECAARDHIDFW